MPALLGRLDQVCPRELAEMAACSLRRHMRRVGEFARGQRAAVEQCAKDIGARRIANQRRNGSHIEDFTHG